MIAGYWITNIAGIILMHKGAKTAISKKAKKYTKKELIQNLIVSVEYIAAVVFLVLMGWLRLPTDYFGNL